MVKLIDTHAHIFVAEINDIATLMEDAFANNVNYVVMPNIDIESIALIKATNKKYPLNTGVLMGLHPCSVKENYKDELAFIKESFNQKGIIGIGEIGLDFYWSLDFKNEQILALETQLQWAVEMGFPVSLHTRNATAETIEVCRNFNNLNGVFHCFGGDLNQANQIIEMGMYLGIGGVVTFKNSGLDKIVEQIDLKHLVLETDTPYLAPHPFRGKENQPKYLKLIAEKIAEIKGVSLETVATITTQNAKKIFNIA